MLEILRYLIGSRGPSGFGSKSTAEEVTRDCSPRLGSITAIITGATSGIGAETARVLAKRGARLVLPARSVKAADEGRARILAQYPWADIIVLPLDLSSLSSVRMFASRFLDLGLPLNLLINNAGKFSYSHALTEDGVEQTFATNYLGHFLLTNLLLDNMVGTARDTGVEGRIVNVSSAFHCWFSGDPIDYLHHLPRNPIGYSGTQSYAVSKLANVLHARELAERLTAAGAGVTVNCVHPGVVHTRLTRDRDGFFTDLVFFLASKLLKTVGQAAATTCYVAGDDRLGGVTGRYFVDCNEAAPSRTACDRKEAQRLWRLSEALISAATPHSAVTPPNSLCLLNC